MAILRRGKPLMVVTQLKRTVVGPLGGVGVAAVLTWNNRVREQEVGDALRSV